MPAPRKRMMDGSFMLPFGLQFNELCADAALHEEYNSARFAVAELRQHVTQRSDTFDLSLVDREQHIPRGQPGQRGPTGILHGANAHARRVRLQPRFKAITE